MAYVQCTANSEPEFQCPIDPSQYLLLERACSLLLLWTLPLKSITLNIKVTKSNGHCPWQVGLPQGWSSSLKIVIIGDILESIRFNMETVSKKKYGLKMFYFAWEAFLSKLVFSHYEPPNPPHHLPLGLSGWEYQEGWRGSHKGEKNKLTLKFILGDLKHF